MMKMAGSSQKRVENTVGKGEIVHYGFQKTCILQTRKNQGFQGCEVWIVR